jgi:hypothetical protein
VLRRSSASVGAIRLNWNLETPCLSRKISELGWQRRTRFNFADCSGSSQKARTPWVWTGSRLRSS